MVRPFAEPGSTAASFPKNIAIGQTNANQRTRSDMAGDLRGQTIAAFCTTAPLLVRTANPGVIARSSYGGTNQSKSGRDMTTPTFLRRRHHKPRANLPVAREWKLLVAPSLSPCILMALVGSMCLVD